MIFLIIIAILALFFMLFKSVDLLVVSLRHLALKSHISLFAATAVLMALATSFPELSVAFTSGFEGASSLSLGNVIGANITNLSFVVGLATLLTGSMVVHGDLLRRDILLAGLSGLAPLLLLLDGSLSRIDGLILILVYLAYAASFFHVSAQKIAQSLHTPSEKYLWRKLDADLHFVVGEGKDLGKLFLGAALMILSADLIVKLASHLARTVHLPQFVVGLFLLALGTTLPELAFSLKALGQRSISLFYGNLLGSLVANSTLVIGLAVLISPISQIHLNLYLTASIIFIFIFILFWFFVRSKHRLDRHEAALLLAGYIIFILLALLS